MCYTLSVSYAVVKCVRSFENKEIMAKEIRFLAINSHFFNVRLQGQ